MRKKLVSAVICATMLAGMMAGCGNTNTSSQADNSEGGKGEPVTISYACWDSKQAKRSRRWQMNSKKRIRILRLIFR